MSEPAWDEDKVEVLFEALFDLRALLARLVELVEGDDDDGREEEEEEEDPE